MSALLMLDLDRDRDDHALDPFRMAVDGDGELTVGAEDRYEDLELVGADPENTFWSEGEAEGEEEAQAEEQVGMLQLDASISDDWDDFDMASSSSCSSMLHFSFETPSSSSAPEREGFGAAEDFLTRLDHLEAARPTTATTTTSTTRTPGGGRRGSSVEADEEGPVDMSTVPLTVPGGKEGIWGPVDPRDWIDEADLFEASVSLPKGARYYY